VTVVGPPIGPERRLRRAPWRSVEFVSLDFEATGLDFRRDTIVSFGTVPVRRGRIEVGGSIYELVDPGDVTPSPGSVIVHGLRPVDLVEAPSVDAARETLSVAIARRFLLTWWGSVEAAFLDKLFGGGQRLWQKRMVDVRDLVLALDGTAAAQLTLSGAAEHYRVPVASPHHALDDALVTAQLFLVMAAKLDGRAGSVRDFQRLRPTSPRHLSASDRPASPRGL
jgi:DNA polymerase-3 subunit epsilon